ncbi:hypothetical protein ASE76_12720 [Xylophilus sp. Leaf220]|nr:hypothetical protein ASE76_12720 [Xylophilus sp. Leaf220]
MQSHAQATVPHPTAPSQSPLQALAPAPAARAASAPQGAATAPSIGRWPAYLFALWGLPTRVATLDEPATRTATATALRPVLTGRAPEPAVLHLPPAPPPPPPGWTQATASHAAAHWRFGGPPAPRARLKPVQQALFGALEDARVEWLALQELPGLRGIWLPFHAGPDAPQGLQFEALLARLSHCLLDPGHADPHPWVARARAVFYTPQGGLALRDTAEVRQAASVLGHDIGQMRLPFNAATYRVHAAYRDDHHWLWEPDDTLPPSATPLEGGGSGASAAPAPDAVQRPRPPDAARAAEQGDPGEGAGPGGGTPVAYAEWDARIGRYRPAWCQVFEHPPRPVGPAARRQAAAGVSALARRCAQALPAGGALRPAGRAARGEDFHAAALVEARLQQRLRQTPAADPYRRLQPDHRPLAVAVLLDTSVSTGDAVPGGRPIDRLGTVALATLQALALRGHRGALWSFASRGRHRIDLACLQTWADTVDTPAVAARIAELACAGSTRLGTVLRHGLAACGQDAAGAAQHRPLVLLLTDGEAHDVDVHTPGYLQADLARAVEEAAAQGIAVRCLAVPPARPAALVRAFGPGGAAVLRHAAQLPQVLGRLLRT